jgi:hypothetical protein
MIVTQVVAFRSGEDFFGAATGSLSHSAEIAEGVINFSCKVGVVCKHIPEESPTLHLESWQLTEAP